MGERNVWGRAHRSAGKSWGDRPSEEVLNEIEARPESYVASARFHSVDQDEGPGALFAYPEADGSVRSFFLPMKRVRQLMRDEGSSWLSWYKREVRPELRTYDPCTEAVILTRHEDGPRVTVVSFTSVR